MQIRTVLTAWAPVELAERLDSLARERGISVSALMREALAVFVYGEAVRLMPEKRGDRDGREAEALAIIRQWPHESCRKLRERLADAGIQRGHNWTWTKRREVCANTARHD